MSDRLLISTRKGLFEVKRNSGSQWSVVNAWFEGDNVTMSRRDPRDGTLFAAFEHGHFGAKLHRSKDDGQSWEEVCVPKYPEGEMLSQPWGAENKDPKPAALELIWALEAGGKDQPGVMWAGTIPGGLFKSTDHGDSWELNRPLWDNPTRQKWFGGGRDQPGLHSIVVNPDDPDEIFIGVSCGGVWRTADGGKSWESRTEGMWADYMPPEQKFDVDIQDPHHIVACPSNMDHMWAQHHNGIFHSTNRGVKWDEVTDVDPSSFGFGVVVHPNDPKIAWFVPAVTDEKRIACGRRVVVTRTQDGGASFDVLQNGLPDEFAYDLVFRHALDIDGSGDRLAFGSTTGSLWISENGGDSWDTVSTHLPPIYAVEFV